MATLTRVRRRGVVARAGSVVTRARSDPFPVALAPSPGHSNDHRPAVRPSLRTTMDQTHPDCILSPAKAAGPGGVSLDDFLDEVCPSALHLTPLIGRGRDRVERARARGRFLRRPWLGLESTTTLTWLNSP
jgi:hypothetical protein